MNKHILSLCKSIYTNEKIPGYTYKVIDGIKMMYRIENKTATIIFRGTSNLLNIETDKDLLDKEIPGAYPMLFKELYGIILNNSIDHIVLGGHSLGGNIVQFFSKILSPFLKSIKGFTFNAFGCRIESVRDAREDTLMECISNTLNIDRDAQDREYLINTLLHRVYKHSPKSTTYPAVKPISFFMKNISGVNYILEGYKNILSEEIVYRGNIIKNGLVLLDIPITNKFGVKFGIGDINTKPRYAECVGTRMIYDKEAVAYFGVIFSLVEYYINHFDKFKDNVSVINYAISGDLVGTLRKSSIGETVLFEKNKIPRVGKYHGIALFDKYIK